MTNHEKVYREFFDIGIQDAAPCERCIMRKRMGLQNHVNHSDDVHHCKFRSAGGDDVIENLGGVCRKDHKILHSDVEENELFGMWCKELGTRTLIIRAFLFREL